MFKGERENGIRVEQGGHASIFKEASKATQSFYKEGLICVEQGLGKEQYSLQEAESLVKQARLFGIKVEREELFDPEEEVPREEELDCLAQVAVARFVRQQNPLVAQEEERRAGIIIQRLEACGFPRDRSVSKLTAWFNFNLRAPFLISFWRLKEKLDSLF